MFKLLMKIVISIVALASLFTCIYCIVPLIPSVGEQVKGIIAGVCLLIFGWAFIYGIFKMLSETKLFKWIDKL